MEHEIHTGERDAASCKSGQPVDHSGPGLNEPTFPPTSDRKPEARPPVQHKSGWGSGGEAPRGETNGEAVPNSPFLDQLEINRNTSGRRKHCGRFTVRGQDVKTARTVFCRINCKCWNCSYCAPKKAKRYKRAIREVAERQRLCRFVTLTLDPSKIEGDPVRYLNAVFAKLRTYLKRRFRIAPTYIRVLEFQKSGNPHFHLLIDRYVEWVWLRDAWETVGGGSFVNIKYVDVHRVSRYLSKYLTKELLLSAPLRSRRVTTSRSIHLFEKQPCETEWQFLRTPILCLYDRYKASVLTTELDEESVLKSFSMSSGGALEKMRV